MDSSKAAWNASQSAGIACLGHWQRAVRWRQVVEKELEPLGLSFVEWLVLDAARRVVRRSGDAVSQSQVAEHTSLDKMTVSRAMRELDHRGLVSRGPDMNCIAYRVFATEEGLALADACGARIDAASACFLDSLKHERRLL